MTQMIHYTNITLATVQGPLVLYGVYFTRFQVTDCYGTDIMFRNSGYICVFLAITVFQWIEKKMLLKLPCIQGYGNCTFLIRL